MRRDVFLVDPADRREVGGARAVRRGGGRLGLGRAGRAGGEVANAADA